MSGSKKNLESKLSVHERQALVDFDNKGLSISAQAQLLGINRSSLYYKPVKPTDEELEIKMYIDKIYTAHPEFGYRRICVWLNKHHNIHINHKTVLKYMQEMGIQAVYPRQNTSRPKIGNKIYPYLLENLKIDHPNHVWSIDITYIPIKKSWLYLTAIVDWYSRYIVDFRISDTLVIDFVLDVSHSALKKAVPKIMNSDQGSHFTSPKYTQIFLDAGSKISMDHRGRAYDNIFIERLWRSIKYEDIYLKEYSCPKEARQGINKYMNYYNMERPHQSLGYHTPEEIYFSK